ncbi:MAG: DJ-1/PfpI family protein [Candidatus Micrarchaeia archaeon]
MKVAIIIPCKDFKDETLSQAKLLLKKKDIDFAILSFKFDKCKGYHGATESPDGRADEFEPEFFDGILLVDGPGIDAERLFENRPLLDRIKLAYEGKRPIAAVGNAIKILAKANIVKGVKLARVEDEETKRLVGLYQGVISNLDFSSNKGIVTISDSSKMQDLIASFEEMLRSRPVAPKLL